MPGRFKNIFKTNEKYKNAPFDGIFPHPIAFSKNHENVALNDCQAPENSSGIHLSLHHSSLLPYPQLYSRDNQGNKSIQHYLTVTVASCEIKQVEYYNVPHLQKKKIVMDITLKF